MSINKEMSKEEMIKRIEMIKKDLKIKEQLNMMTEVIHIETMRITMPDKVKDAMKDLHVVMRNKLTEMARTRASLDPTGSDVS